MGRTPGAPRSAWRVWPWAVAVLGCLGAILWLTSYPVFDGLGRDTVERLLRDFGITLLISMIAALALERLVHESLLGDVHRSLEVMQRGSDVLKGAAVLGIEGIYARREPGTRERWSARVTEAFERQIARSSGEVLIACVAAPDFFREGTEIGDMLWNGLSDAGNHCGLRVLLLCPHSKWAGIRQFLEPGHPTRADMSAAAQFLYNLEQTSGKKVAFRCYDLPPFTFLVITDDLLFLEPYPMVKVGHGQGPIGGRGPIILARRDTETYRRWRGTFEYIWQEFSLDYKGHHPDVRDSGLPPDTAGGGAAPPA